jgi:sec-independent protein translocase protein TatA
MFIPLLFEDIAASELVVIMLFVLLFFGAKSIPGIAKTLGRALYEFRNAQSELQREIKKSGMDIKKDMNISSLLKETTQEISQPLDQVATEISNTVEYRTVGTTTSGNPETVNNELEDSVGQMQEPLDQNNEINIQNKEA